MTNIIGRRRLILMRHGHVDYFQEGLTDFRSVNLTEIGQSQAHSAGKALKDQNFDIAFHSGLPRTIQTSEIVLSHNSTASKMKPTQLCGMEELTGGVYVTDSREELAARLAFSFEEADKENAEFLPGGERFSDAYQRVINAFEDMVLGYPWKKALLVAHEGVNKLILGYASKAGLKGISSFEQDLCGINLLDLDVVSDEEGKPKIERIIIKAVNVTPYDTVKSKLHKTSLEHMFNIDFNGNRMRF